MLRFSFWIFDFHERAVRVRVILRMVMWAKPNLVAVVSLRNQTFSAFANVTDKARGNANDERVCGNVFGDERAGANHRPRADR